MKSLNSIGSVGMRSGRKMLFILLLLVAGMFSFQQSVKAQTPAVFDDPGGETGGDGNGSFGDGPVVPLDGGMSLLLLASGIGYVRKQMHATNIRK